MDTVDITTQYYTGEDKTLRFTIYEEEAHTTPQDITGWTLSWMVKKRKTYADADATLTKTTSSGITVISAANGVVDVVVSDTDIAAIKGGLLYFHELKRMDAGFETVLSQGTFTLQKAVHD